MDGEALAVAVADAAHTVDEPEFQDVLITMLFITAVWVVGKLFARVGMPALVGEIVIGVLLGPQLCPGLVPEHLSLIHI